MDEDDIRVTDVIGSNTSMSTAQLREEYTDTLVKSCIPTTRRLMPIIILMTYVRAYYLFEDPMDLEYYTDLIFTLPCVEVQRILDCLQLLRRLDERRPDNNTHVGRLIRTPSDSTRTQSRARYSCPFRKRNPLKFNVRDYQTCALSSFVDITQVKRHILSVHGRKEYSQEVDDPESGLSADIESRLRERRTSHRVMEWNELWAVLFPTDIFIPTGVYEPVVEDHELHLHQHFYQSSDSICILSPSSKAVVLVWTFRADTKEDTLRVVLKPSPTLGLLLSTPSSASARNIGGKRHTSTTVKRKRSPSCSNPNSDIGTHSLERPNKSLRRLAPFPSLSSPGEALWPSPGTARKPMEISGEQILHRDFDDRVIDLDAPFRRVDNVNAQPPTHDSLIGTENEPCRLQRNFDAATEITFTRNDTPATNQSEEHTDLGIEWNMDLNTLDPAQYMGFSCFTAQDMDDFDLS